MAERTQRQNQTRGGDLDWEELRRYWKVHGSEIVLGALTGFITLLLTARVLAWTTWPLYWKYNAARIADLLFLGNSRLLAMNGYTPARLLQEFGGIYHQTFWFTSFIAFGAGVAVGWKVYQYWKQRHIRKGEEASDDEFLRGAQLLTKDRLTADVEAAWATQEKKFEEDSQKAEAEGTPAPEPLPPKYTFADVPIPPRMAQRNILATGGMGSGKSVAIFNLADQVARAGRTMIVYDKVTEFATYYYRKGKDVKFNPFDADFPGWNIFNELSHVYEFDQMASYLIPTSEKASGTEDYFKSAARTIFACVLQKLYEEGRTDPSRRTNEALCKAIFETGQEALYEWLKGTPAESLLNPESKGTGGGGVLTTLTEAVKVLRYVPSGDFSLKKFIRDGGDRRLFITSKEEVHPILQPLTAMAMNILITAVMAGKQVKVDKFWFFMDEFKSMGKLPVFSTAVTEARKYGAVFVVGAQNTMQFTEMFGEEAATTIRSNLAIQLILRVADEKTAKNYSDLIGNGEYLEQSESKSLSSHDEKDSEGIQYARKNRIAVMPEEIMMFPDCTGVLRLPGYHASKLSYGFSQRDVIAKGWEPRADLDLDAPGNAAPKATPAVTAAQRLAALVKSNAFALDLQAKGWTFHVGRGKSGTSWCIYDSKRISMSPAHLLSDRMGYADYVFAHEMAHAYAGAEANHGPEFMKWLQQLCPPAFVHYELEYKPRNAKAAGIEPGDLDDFMLSDDAHGETFEPVDAPEPEAGNLDTSGYDDPTEDGDWQEPAQEETSSSMESALSFIASQQPPPDSQPAARQIRPL